MDCHELKFCEFEPNAQLADHIRSIILVKGFHQHEQNERYVRRLSEGGHLGSTHNRPYRTGAALVTSLAPIHFLADSALRMLAREPNWIDFSGKEMVVALGDELLVAHLDTRETRRIRNPWFAQIRSAVFSNDCRRILVASSGFDTVIEVDAFTGTETWRWSAWESGFNFGADGSELALVIDALGDTPHVRVNGIDFDTTVHARTTGLPLRRQACHVNHAMYAPAGHSIYVVLFHQGAILEISREGNARVLSDGFRHPHGLCRIADGTFMIADTQNGRCCFLDSQMHREWSVSFHGTDGIRADRVGGTEWIQNVTPLGDSLYGAVDTHRSQIHVFDPVNQQRCSLDSPPDWAIQYIAPIPSEFDNLLPRGLVHV